MIHTLPCIRYTAQVNDACFNFKLRLGLSAETSGGLLTMCVVWRFVCVRWLTHFAYCPRPLPPPSALSCRKWMVGLRTSSVMWWRAQARPASCRQRAALLVIAAECVTRSVSENAQIVETW